MSVHAIVMERTSELLVECGTSSSDFYVGAARPIHLRCNFVKARTFPGNNPPGKQYREPLSVYDSVRQRKSKEVYEEQNTIDRIKPCVGTDSNCSKRAPD
jgi:hypothetical protein